MERLLTTNRWKQTKLSVVEGGKLAVNTHRHHVVHSVDVAVAHVHPDGLQGETVLLPRDVDDNGRLQTGRAERQVAVGGGVPGRGVGGERARGDGTGLEATRTVV